jgi:hypothetical protein
VPQDVAEGRATKRSGASAEHDPRLGGRFQMTDPRADLSIMAIFVLGAFLAATTPAKGQIEAVPSLRPQQALPNSHGGNSAGPGASTPSDSLGHELSRSRGVIKPPPTPDQNILTPPNENSVKTPVIAPPGTPGGNPAVIPK